MTDPVITASRVSRRFGDQVVLADVSLELVAGEVLGLIGPNGGGKSTLLLLLAGLIAPTTGEVRVDGVHATELALQASGRVGLVTAEAGLYPLLTGRENLHFFGGLFGFSAVEVDAKTAPLTKRLKVANVLDRAVGAFSSGMCQKLSLVRALMLSPAALLLDEPTANLDPVAAGTIYQAIRDQADAGTAVALVTHDLHAAESLCERVALIKGGVTAIEQQPGPRGAPSTGRLLQLYKEGR